MLTFKEYILLKEEKFMDIDVHTVDHDTFCKCLKGKKLGDRWLNYVDDPDLRNTLKKQFYTRKQVVLKSDKTDGMIFLRQQN